MLSSCNAGTASLKEFLKIIMEFSWFENVEIKQIVLLKNRVAERIDVILYASRPGSDLSLRRIQIQKPFKKSTKNN